MVLSYSYKNRPAKAHFRVLFCLCRKTSLRAKLSFKNEFDFHENELVGETHFRKDGFALRLVLTQRQTRTRKWAISKKPERVQERGLRVVFRDKNVTTV